MITTKTTVRATFAKIKALIPYLALEKWNPGDGPNFRLYYTIDSQGNACDNGGYVSNVLKGSRRANDYLQGMLDGLNLMQDELS